MDPRWFTILPFHARHAQPPAELGRSPICNPSLGVALPSGTSDFLYATDAWLIVLVLVAVLLLATELAFRTGRLTASRYGEVAKEGAGTIQGAVLALDGLLLAFTFSLAAARFDARKLLVVDEANAIGTAHRRAALAPEPERGAIEDVLRRYVDARLEAVQAGTDERARLAATARDEELQRELWSLCASLGRSHPTMTMSLLISSGNDVIDVAAKQAMALDDHVPESVLFLLYLASALAMAAIGFENGLNGLRQPVVTSILTVLIALTVFVILDLDRPRRGLIRVSQKSMLELRDDLARQAAARE